MTTMAATMMARIKPVRLVSRPATRRPGWTRNRIRWSAWTSTGVADGASVAVGGVPTGASGAEPTGEGVAEEAGVDVAVAAVAVAVAWLRERSSWRRSW